MSDIVRRVNLYGCIAIDDEGQPVAGGAQILNFHRDGSVTWDNQVKFIDAPARYPSNEETAE